MQFRAEGLSALQDARVPLICLPYYKIILGPDRRPFDFADHFSKWRLARPNSGTTASGKCRPHSPRFAHALRGTAPAMEGPPRDAAEVGARYARRDAEHRAGKAKAG